MPHRRLTHDLQIKFVDNHEGATRLVEEQYRSRGYELSSTHAKRKPVSITIIADYGGYIEATLTVAFEMGHGLNADKTFPNEIDQFRLESKLLCEFTKLAASRDHTKSHKSLAGIFHAAYLLAHCIRRIDQLVIEVNPRHVGYYKHLLSLKELSGIAHNEKVGAPAVLLGIEFSKVAKLIAHAQRGGKFEHRSLYPSFFDLHTEKLLLERLKKHQGMPHDS